ncbi:hypothetical protein COJ21_23865 [Priestia megaterium]|nr:hypothetical protein COJ21_23865 [Priestia megaterium]RFB19478.1 hypothetical protein DZB87_28755 [Bacillus sp. ALD]RFB32609.1 hypothetical protein DZB86_29690 [Bacillus sp. RC]
MIQELLKQYKHTFMVVCSTYTLLQIVIIFVMYILTKNLLHSVVLSLIYIFHVTTHEFGHIFFLKLNKVPYELKSYTLSIEVSFLEKEFYSLEKFRKVLITVGGSIFAILFDVLLYAITHAKTYLTLFIAMLIIIELLNLFFGKDSKVLETVLKER